MKRIERAKIIRDVILALPREEWRWTMISGVRCFHLTCDGWSAVLTTPFNPLPSPSLPEPSNVETLVRQLKKPAPLPNIVDVWVAGQGKVLSLGWDVDDVRLISMKPGPWEAELFGVGDAG